MRFEVTEGQLWADRYSVGQVKVIEIRQIQEMADFPSDVQEAAAGFTELQRRAAG